MANIESGTWDLNGYDQAVRSTFSKGGITLGGAAGTAAVTTGAGLLTIQSTQGQSRIDYLSANNPQGAVINGRMEYNNANNLMLFVVEDSTNAPIDLTINATISKAGAPNTGTFFMGGGGSLLLNGANTFAANIIRIDSGSMILGTNDPANGSAGALGASANGVSVGFNDASSGSGTLLLRDGVTSARTVRTINNTNVARAADTRTLGGYDSTGTATFSGAIELWNSANDGATARLQALGASTVRFTGNISDNPGDSPVGITKIGSGTVVLSGSNTFRGGIAVNAGVLELNASSGAAAATASTISVATNAILLVSKSNQVNNSATVTLSGGTIQRASGVNEVFGNLNLTTGSFLDFGTGATGTLEFGTYTPSSLLTVQNFAAGNILKFGNDIGSYLPTGGALTNSFFSFNNGFSYNNASFTITAIPEPSTVLAALGLTGLMLWPVAKRRLMASRGVGA
jgi:autotransporter-associated beta strand protein